MAGPALRQLGQLPAAGRTGHVAVVGGADPAADRRRLAAQEAAGQEARMIGYAWLGLLALGALGLLWTMKLRGSLLTLAAAAMAFGCAGYALQGSPGLEGNPRTAAERAPPLPL